MFRNVGGLISTLLSKRVLTKSFSAKTKTVASRCLCIATAPGTIESGYSIVPGDAGHASAFGGPVTTIYRRF